MDVMGKAGRGRTNLVGAALLGALVLGTAVLAAVASGDFDGRARGAVPPETFFAMRRVGAEIVEVDTNNGRVERAIVDLGPDGEAVANTGGLIDGIDLSADRRALYFSRYSQEPGTVYRVWLPDGSPERVAEGHGASVSPDGRQLALLRGSDLVIRDLTTQQERVFGAVVGELGGSGTAWAADSRRLAVEISGADVTVVNIVDTRNGRTTDLQPVDQPAIEYRVIGPAYRPGHGLLGVVCCHDGDIVDGEPPQSMILVLHDPTNGIERSRITLPAPASDIDWDRSGSHLLLTNGDRVRHYHDGRFSDIQGVDDVFAVAW